MYSYTRCFSPILLSTNPPHSKANINSKFREEIWLQSWKVSIQCSSATKKCDETAPLKIEKNAFTVFSKAQRFSFLAYLVAKNHSFSMLSAKVNNLVHIYNGLRLFSPLLKNDENKLPPLEIFLSLFRIWICINFAPSFGSAFTLLSKSESS